MKKEIILLCIIAVFSNFVFSVLAQEQRNEENSEKTEKTTYLDNWFISLGTGANLLWGEQDEEIAGLTDRLKWGGCNFSLGKWFSPTFGARIQVMTASLKGFNYFRPMGRSSWYYHMGSPTSKSVVPNGFINPLNSNNSYIDLTFYEKGSAEEQNIIYDEHNWRNFELVTAKNGDRAFAQKFNYYSVTLDLMTNFTYLFRGPYKENMLLDVIPFAGFGLIYAEKGSATITYNYGVIKVGIRPSFNIKNWAIFAELQGNITSHDFDSYVGDELFDLVFHASVGLQYTFNKRFASPSIAHYSLSRDEIDYLNEKINQNRSLIDKHQIILERQQDLLDKLNSCCDETRNSSGTESVTHIYHGSKGYMPEYIRFALNSAQIQFTEDNKFRDVVEFLTTHPNSKLLLVGYADKKTGTSSYNFELSRKRVEAVSQELIRRGIDSQRLILEWKGDQEQPYEPNEWNRVVIMVERN
jgi:outer membrane protein OmpA-like peptidoglycan-associated protein